WLVEEDHRDRVPLAVELDPVHELADQEDPAAVRASPVRRQRRIRERIGIEAAPLVRHPHHHRVRGEVRFDQDTLVRVRSVPVQHRVRKRLAHPDTEIQTQAVTVETGLVATRHQVIDGAFDRSQIVGELQYEVRLHGRPGVTVHTRSGPSPARGAVPIEGAPLPGGPSILTLDYNVAARRKIDQKDFSASWRLAEIWKSVSSFVSSKRVRRSSLRFARRSSPPCSRIFFDRLTRTPSPDESM